MFSIVENDNIIIHYQDNLKLVAESFCEYYDKQLEILLKKFCLEEINKVEVRIFCDNNLLGNIPYKLGDFAGFFNANGVNCYINICGKKSNDDIMKLIMHEIVHHIYRYYVEDNVSERITWFDEGLAMNFSNDHDKYNDDNDFIKFFKDKILSVNNLPCINDLHHGVNFITDDYNGYDLSYFVVRYLIETLKEEDFYLLMKNKNAIKTMGVNIINDAIDFYLCKYDNFLKR